MKKDNSEDNLVNQIVAKVIANNKKKKVKVTSDTFIYGLFEGDAVKQRCGVANLLLIIGVILAGISALIALLVFSYKDVLFFKNKVQVNECGTFIPKQSANREYALFLFHSSDMWANSGVQVQKGDKVYLSASGAFNGKMTQVLDNASNNVKLEHPWTTAEGKDKVDFVICPEYPFGTVLFTVNKDKMSCMENSTRGKVYSLAGHLHNRNQSKSGYEIDKNGQLFFSVNDIFLSPEIYEKIKNIDTSKLGNEKFKQEVKDLPSTANINNNREAWFNDNIGDILICAEIEHNGGNTALTKYFKNCDLQFEKSFEQWNISSGFWSKIYSILLFCLAIILTIAFSFWYLLWLIVPALGIWLIINLKPIIQAVKCKLGIV